MVDFGIFAIVYIIGGSPPCINKDVITLPANYWVFSRFGRLSPAAVLLADDHPLSDTDTENPFYLTWTAPNSPLNLRRVFVFGREWANAAPSSKTTYAKLYTQYLLISLRCQLSKPTLIYDRSNYFVDFRYVFRNNCWFWATRAFSAIGDCTTTFKFGIPVDDCWFPWCRVPISLIKPLLRFNFIFPIKKQCLINTRNSFLSIVLKMTKVASLKPLSEILKLNVSRLVLSTNHMDLTTVVPSICQIGNLFSDMLFLSIPFS